MRVLLVDDDPALLRCLARVLRAEGHEVATVDRPHRAEDVLRTFAPDVVLSDLEMGDVSGIDLIRRLRERSPPPHCVLMTGRAHFQMPEDLADVPLLLKPFRPAAMRKALGAPRR